MDCPCCGQPYPVEPDELMLFDDYRVVRKGSNAARLSPMQYKIINLVHRRPLTLDAIVDAVYSDRTDGGPLVARNTVAVHMVRLNERLEPLGIRVCASRMGGWGPTYKIENVDRQQA